MSWICNFLLKTTQDHLGPSPEAIKQLGLYTWFGGFFMDWAAGNDRGTRASVTNIQTPLV